MNRQIKFRGKRCDTGVWIYGDLLTFNERECEITDWNTVDCSRYDVDPDTVGQLIIPADYEHNNTGFDFYEGDIVDEFGALRELRFEICDDTQGFDVNLDFWQCKVIGNIHDNPELLKNK